MGRDRATTNFDDSVHGHLEARAARQLRVRQLVGSRATRWVTG